MNKELISVIIPVYKVEKYIKRCVDSVIAQTYENLEIILVDDGSPDKCPIICDEYARKDNRIKVIHKKNGGLSDARNVGIEKSTGKYVTFIDSDDWIPQDSINTLYENIKMNNADISSGNLKEVFKNNDTELNSIEQNVSILNTKDSIESLMYLHNLSNSASGKLYKKELFDNIKYPIGKYYEDLATTYKLFDASKKIAVSDKIVYYYYQNSNSIMHKKYSIKRLDSYEFICEQMKFIKRKYPDIVNSVIYRLLFECFSILNDMPFLCSEKKYIKNTIKKYRKIAINDIKLSNKQKFLCYSSYFGQLGIKIAFFLRKLKKRR